jgi:hypothetical protein
MRKNLLVVALLASAFGAFGQGTVNFNNRLTSGSPPDTGPVVAPFFNVNPANPTERKGGNPTSDWNGTSGPAPVPTGTQVYAGAPLVGTGFTVTLWAANVNQPDSALQLVSTTTMTTRANANFVGFINAPSIAPVVPGVVGNTSDRAKFEIRVWDNKGGTITSWDQVLLTQNNNVARGMSGILTIDSPLGIGSTPAPTLQNLRSFQLFVVPEPSVIALGVLGAGCLFLLRRRK